MTSPEHFGAIVGRNVRRLRVAKLLTQEELVHHWDRMGFHWARSKLAALESGKRPMMDVGTFHCIALGLDVLPRDLLAGEGDVYVGNAGRTMPLADLRRSLAGGREA